MCTSFARMSLLLVAMIFCQAATAAFPEITHLGPESGIALRDQPGLLITNCRLHTQKVFVKLDPHDVYIQQTKTTVQLTGYAGAAWSRQTLSHAEVDTRHMLQQLQKFTVSQTELNGLNNRPKRFIGGLLSAASMIGSLFSIGMSTVNSVSLNTVRRHVSELEAEIPDIRAQIVQQRTQLQTIGQTLKGTVLIVNAHGETLNKTLRAVNSLLSVVQVDVAYAQLLGMLTEDMLREVGSSVDNLAAGRIPSYLVPLSLVENLLTTSTRDIVTPLQAHLAYSLGSAVPIYVNPDQLELSFLINLPIVSVQNIYRLKDVINVGFWKGDSHVKVHSPSVIAYHDSNPDLYLAPNLRMCTLTKDIHYLCPSKPFMRDGTNGICGLTTMVQGTPCPVTITHRSQVVETQAEIVGGRWLVNTPANTALLSYDQHDTSTRIPLPSETFWVDVPENAILHIENLALYHLDSEVYQSRIELPDFFSAHALDIDPSTIEQVRYEGTKTIDVAPIDDVLKEIAAAKQAPIQPYLRDWSTPDSLIASVVALGYLLTFGLTFFYLRRTRALQAKLKSCSERFVRMHRRRRGYGDAEPTQKDDDPVFGPLELTAV